MKYLIILGLFSLLFSHKTWAYPQFVSYGYRSCQTCHYNPLGNGPLNDYGRAVSATAISDRLLVSKTTSEEELGQQSAFNFKGWDKNTWFRPQINYRGLNMTMNVGEDNSSNEFYQMMANVVAVGKFMKRDKLIVVGEIGYSPVAEGSDEIPVRSREYYVGYRFNKKLGAYAGLMDKAYGIRLVDHTAFSRSAIGLGQNDQTHGLMLHYSTKKMEAAVHGFAGNMLNDDNVRQMGGSGTMEFTLNPDLHLGGSALYSSSDFTKYMMGALHGRLTIGKGNSLLIEGGLRQRTIVSTEVDSTALYGMLRGQIKARRGLFINLGSDWYKANTDADTSSLRLVAGAQWFPINRIELRVDFYNSQTLGSETATSGIYAIASQVHLWL